ncbi:hypothetical protein [Corallococcus exercitus]|uniref:hypothetical protein n=1 Tax=Corallococcus exercitus TaxID=2316736 RepID=UPI0035D48A72
MRKLSPVSLQILRRDLPLAVLAMLFALGVSRLRAMAELDVDAAVHLYRVLERDLPGLVTFPYAAHKVLLPVYAVSVKLTQWLGGDVLLGFRLLHAAALALAGVLLCRLLGRCGVAAWPAVLLSAAWVTCGGNLFLLRTFEDDVLYLPWQVALLGLFVSRLESWSARDAWVGGLMLGAAWLMHYPALVWAGPMLLACASGGPREQPWLSAGRLRSLGAVLLGGLVVLLAFGVVRWLCGGSWASYVELLLLKPNAVVGKLASPAWMLIRLSNMPAVLVPFWPWAEMARPTLLQLAFAVGILVWSLIALLRPLRKAEAATPRERVSTFVFRSLVICSLPSVIIPDGALYERMGHVALFALVLLGLRLAPPSLTAAPASDTLPPAPPSASPRASWGAAALVSTSLLWAAWQERDSSWMARYTALREAHPEACRFVFSESEFTPGDIHEYGRAFALLEALPSHRLIRTSDVSWKVAPRFTTPGEARSEHRDCVWYSAAGRALMRHGGAPASAGASPGLEP